MNIPEGMANVTFVWSVAGVLDEMGYSIGVSGVSAVDAGEIAIDADAAYVAAGFGVGASIFPGWTYKGTRVVKTVGGEPSHAELPLAINGSGVGDTIPPNCALLIRKNTAVGGRANRGRMYQPPFNLGESGINAAGVVSGSLLANLQAGYTNLLAEFAARGLEPRLFHSDPLAAPTLITSLSVQSLLATQRRRMR